MANRIVDLSPSPSSFQCYDFARLFASEDRHFWFRARNRIIAILVKQVTSGLSSGYKVLEVGCGTGNVLRVLEQACPGGRVIGMDLFTEGLKYARHRTKCLLVQGDIHSSPFTAKFDVVGLFDVLEHLPDDVQILHDLYAMLKPGAVLLLTVPANPSLWSYVDEASQHYRRYMFSELEGKLSCAGYEVEYLTHFMACIYPLVWLKRRLTGLVGLRTKDGPLTAHKLALDELRILPVFNELLSLMLFQEARLIARRRRLPGGTSLLAIARKSHTEDG